MTIHFQLAEQEVICGIAKIRRQPIYNWWAWTIIGLVGIILLAHGWHTRSRYGRDYFVVGGTMLWLGLYVCLLHPVLFRRRIATFVRRNPTLFTGPQELTFDRQGLEFSSPTIKQSIIWDAYRTLAQDKHYFYLYSHGYSLFTILPKRAFDPYGLDEFLRCSHSLQPA